MSTIVHFECRSAQHLESGSRRGIGGLVIHHGSVGYCDGVNVDGAHRWVATGGVPIEYLYESGLGIDGPGTYRAAEGPLVHVRSSATGALVVEVDDRHDARTDLHVRAKLSDDPDWPDLSRARMTLLPAD
jgi:hypothetical protein